MIVGWADQAARPERLCVYLGHDALAVCRVTGRFKPIVQDKAVLLTDAGVHDLTSRLAALDAWLDSHPVRGAIDWIIGIDYVRYLLLPWNPRLVSDAFCRSLTAALFAQHFAADAIPFADHQLRFAPVSFGHPRLAALIGNDVIGELTAFSKRRKYRIRQIAPALSVAWNRLFPQVKLGAGVLALIEGPRLLRVASNHGHITAFSIQPYCYSRSSAIPDDVTWVFPAHHLAASAGHMLTVDGHEPDDDVRLAYALCGAV
ncbi:hypothetical protein [Burkholderia stagnalis]|uniref:hypothetical protein n=1 Tax=Burkholderia stagnalis TaxID=1503054 RepID=UPI00075B2584|nr:hypothetical protein [Burkholderia stagnalis]KVO61491.1 hypothetical protein WT18_09755 [Burkholderia stagnalis]KVP13094.1 hypothetical protein WT20_11470 [Burkholderia stagnalis]KVW96607.1 hypothetical protein WT30_12525 [Burkholderia stagnalis]KWH75729.1 hypothetical protein WT66_02755 [Burkholderia stagnalis]KWK19080.1 hypothetical protein WT77_26830 [Burkholderia stagnalis]